jgi:hypothetical protein
MRFAKITLACVCLLGLNQPVWSQKANEPANQGILGYLDPKTGAFRPVAQSPDEEFDTTELAPTNTGKFVFKFTITISSTNLGSDTISCTALASLIDNPISSIFISETASVKATVSGSTASCTVNIPYSWTLKTGSTDTVSLSYVVSAVGPSASGGLPTRTSSQGIANIKVPANGSTTTETVASTI